MSEAAKVRVVRCPKCENLLPEVEDYSLYKCGGCGVVLKGKNNKNGVDLDAFSDGERPEGVIMEKIVNSSDNPTTDTADNVEASSSISSSRRRRRIPRYRDENIMKNNLKIPDYESGKFSDEHERANGLLNLAHGAANEEQGEIQGPRRPTTNRMDYNGNMRWWYSMDGSSSRHEYAYENQPLRSSKGSRINNFEHLGDDKVEALRKLDELKDQLSRSAHLLTAQGKEKEVPSMMMYHHDRAEKYHPDPNFSRPLPYKNRYADGPFPRTKVQEEMGGNMFYPRRYDEYDEGFGDDPFRPRRRPHQDYHVPYSQADVPPYVDKRKPYAPNFSHHHPLCSCYQCLDERQVPPRDNRYAYYTPCDKQMFYSHQNPGSFGSLDYYYGSRVSSNDTGGVSHLRWRPSSDVNSEVNQRVVQLTSSSKTRPPLQHQLPIAGGAPFLTCSTCFELLVLPKTVEINGKGRIRCGACSTVITFSHSKESNNSIVFSKENLCNAVSSRGGKSPDEARTIYSSGGYSSDYGTAKKFDEIKNRNSTSTCTSEVEEDGEHSPAAAVEEGHEDLRPPAGSPLLEHFEFSNKYHRVGDANNGSGTKPEHGKPYSRRKQDSSATEIDLSSSNEYTNTGTTFDSSEKLKHGGGRSAESFLAGFLLKRSVKDDRTTSEAPKSEKANVTVNGHLISDALLEKAKKLAGSIQPGNYWYDFRAGFWGVMGGPCLGIIPPFIEEFNYPMAKDCAGGNTHVFVNGRELNEKDLRLLASRGLPTESHRSYIMEISGRVIDEDTGDELENLGKLAPTVERAKRGFGMKAPSKSI